MSTPDPTTVREIARQQILDDRHRAHDNGSAVLGRFGPDGLTRHEYGAYCSAVREAIRTAQIAVSWPDEQQPADVVTAEQQQDGAVEAVRNFAEVWRASDEWRRALDAGITDSTFFAVSGVRLTEPQLTAVLAERTALAARVAELEGEREADVRAVAEACSDFGNDEGPRGIRQLYARFADRIAALDATETEES